MYTISVVVPSWHYWANPFKHQPYWELYYATILQERFSEKGVTVDMVDLRGAPGDTLPEVVKGIPQRDLYVYWIMKSGDAREVYSTARLLKAQYPQSLHVAGGTHVDMCTEECQAQFDAVVVGPGESSLVKIVTESWSGQPQPLYQQTYAEIPFADTPYPRRLHCRRPFPSPRRRR